MNSYLEITAAISYQSCAPVSVFSRTIYRRKETIGKQKKISVTRTKYNLTAIHVIAHILLPNQHKYEQIITKSADIRTGYYITKTLAINTNDYESTRNTHIACYQRTKRHTQIISKTP